MSKRTTRRSFGDAEGPAHDALEHLPADLWAVSCEVRALAELVMYQRREPALDEEDVWHGYGSLLRKIGERLELWAKGLDDAQVNRASRDRRG